MHTKLSHFPEVIHPSIHFLSPLIPHCGSQGLMESNPGCLGAKSDKSAVYHRANTVRQTSHTHVHTHRQFRVAVYPNVFGKSLQRRCKLHTMRPCLGIEPAATLMPFYWKECFVPFYTASCFVKRSEDRK